MNEQLLVTSILIAMASAYLLQRGWRAWRGVRQGRCGGGCGCSQAIAQKATQQPTLIPSEQLTLRRRSE